MPSFCLQQFKLLSGVVVAPTSYHQDICRSVAEVGFVCHGAFDTYVYTLCMSQRPSSVVKAPGMTYTWVSARLTIRHFWYTLVN